jgi:hypothetical protein
MSNRRANITQSEITRALKAARQAGFSVARFEILSEGGLRIYLAGSSDEDSANEWDAGLGLL